MNPILTIAIPVYNMEKHLERCLSSVLFDGCPQDVEVIIINDGSKDKSKDIIDRYTQLHPSQVIAIHKENGGWGTCMNLAISMAQGKYFKFIDSDDCVSTTGYLRLVDKLRMIDADIIVSPYVEHCLDTSTLKVLNSALYGKLVTAQDFFASCNHFVPHSGRTYKTELIKDVELSPRYYGDLEYNTKPLYKLKTIYFDSEPVYQYFRAIEGQSTSVEGYIRNKGNLLTVCRNLVSFISQPMYDVSDSVRAFVEKDVSKLLVFLYKIFLSKTYASSSQDRKVLREFDAWLKINNIDMWRIVGKLGNKWGVPYIALWRYFRVNLCR